MSEASFALLLRLKDNPPLFWPVRKPLKHPRSSNWFKPGHISCRRLNPEVLSWLLDQGSLTRRLISHCRGQFSVQVLNESWQKADINEAKLLGIPDRQRVRNREVLLRCDNQVMVYARSIIPLKTLKGKHSRLRYLGDRPLGAYLFANPGLKRMHQHLAKISRSDALFNIVLSASDKQCDHIWGRRSMFVIDQKPLLVSEFFLPVLFDTNHNDNNAA